MICAHAAITMEYNNIGRLCPVIDENKCTDCGLCRKNCPALDEKRIQLPDTEDKYIGHIERVYIGKSEDEGIFRNSQSGGMVTATVKYLFDTGKIDAAIMCRVEDAVEYTSKAVVVTSIEELGNCQRSSYVPIDIVSAMKEIEQYNAIAVVGTGCHIQGIRALQNFRKKYNDKIKYTLGLICDRTLCKTVTDVLYDGNFRQEKKRIIWRDKSVNYKTARLLIQTESGAQKELPRWQRFVLKDSFTNPRCRICFDKLNTNSDIVFGDPWDMNSVDWHNGMSLVITRTSHGGHVIQDMIDTGCAILVEAPLDEVLEGQKINMRKQNVSASLSIYRMKGWTLPAYAESLLPSSEIVSLRKSIDEFVADEGLSKQMIIDKKAKMLRRIGINKKLMFCLMLPVKFMRNLLKRLI